MTEQYNFVGDVSLSGSSKREVNSTSSASFIAGNFGQLFCISSKPISSIESVPHIVFIAAPFAEELNRSRRFLTLLRNKLSSLGYEVVQPDLFGTGDSTGDFSHATVDIWLDDLITVTESYVSDRNSLISFLGIRSGCLLIDQLLQNFSHNELLNQVNSIVYVQPEISGFDVIQQMLRSRVAAKRFSGDKSETTEILWEKIESGESVSTAGYVIGAELALSMLRLTIDPQALPPVKLAKWLSFVESDDILCIDNSWKALQLSARPFWQLHDNEPEPYMIERIAKCISDRCDDERI